VAMPGPMPIDHYVEGLPLLASARRRT
jgi:hypothetical protein